MAGFCLRYHTFAPWDNALDHNFSRNALLDSNFFDRSFWSEEPGHVFILALG